MVAGSPFSEDDLHAYLDGGLSPRERVEIATFLAEHPEEAARVEAFRAQHEAMHALYDHVLEQPLPPALRASVRRAGGDKARSQRRRLGRVGLVLVALASMAYGGSYLASPSARAPAARELRPLDRGAVDLPVIRPRHPDPARVRKLDL